MSSLTTSGSGTKTVISGVRFCTETVEKIVRNARIATQALDYNEEFLNA